MRLQWKLPPLYPEQRAAVYDPARYSLIEASTKSGKTAGCMVWLFDLALSGREGGLYRWVAPVNAQSKMVYRRFKQWLAHIPARYCRTVEGQELRIEIAGRALEFRNAERPDNLYGEDCDAVVLDEASRMREEAFDACRSTLTATRGPLRIIGNVKGRRNWFYRMARRAEAGAEGMAFHRITWHEAVAAGVLDVEEIDDARRVFEEAGKLAVFKELYETEPSDDGGNPFGLDAIRECVAELSKKPPVCWGWDLAKSADWCVGIALDEDGAVCHFERFQRPWEEATARIRSQTDGRPALIDSTGVGDPIVERLQRGGRNFEGYKFSSTSKQQLMEGLAVAIGKHEVSYPEGPIVAELEAFEYEYTRTGVRYTAPDGVHDDCVDALALAVMASSKPRGVVVSMAGWR